MDYSTAPLLLMDDYEGWVEEEIIAPSNHYSMEIDDDDEGWEQEEFIAPSTQRSWNDMNHDILVSIMNYMSHEDKSEQLNLVCKSWRSALFDSIFPPGDVLDLRFMDNFLYGSRIFTSYGNYLLEVLNCRQYNKIFLPLSSFEGNTNEEIAKR